MKKASGGDGIAAELFQILKDTGLGILGDFSIMLEEASPVGGI